MYFSFDRLTFILIPVFHIIILPKQFYIRNVIPEDRIRRKDSQMGNTVRVP